MSTADPETALRAARDPWYPGGQRDASIWVEEYLRLYPNGCADGDTMLGWFANAIETGVMFGERAALATPEPPLDEPRLWHALGRAGFGGFSRDNVDAIAREYAALGEPRDG